MENNRRVTSKFTCYFCNKTIENETELGHTAVCGRVLVSCPNKCGSYIPRMDLKKHNRECVNRVNKSMPRGSVPNLNENYSTVPRTYSNQHNVTGTNGIARTDNNDEFYKLSRKLADLESRLQVLKAQNQSTVSIQSFDALKTAQLQLNLDVEKLKYQSQLAFDTRSKIDILQSQVKQVIATMENSKREVNLNLSGLQSRIMLMERLQDQINALKDSFLREQAFNRQVDMEFKSNIDDFQKYFAQENAMNLAILSDLKDSVSSMKLDIDYNKSKLEEQDIKFTNVNYDLRGAGQTASDASKKIDQIEKEFKELRKGMDQMKLDLEIVEGLSSSSDMRNAPGRLLWKITEVDTKMVQAKATGNVVKSPIFFTHEYGYRVRILMYMNGLKKWKERYILLCLHVLKGEYDMILKWPCQIEGTVTIRDLEDLDKTKPFSKVITAKRQSGDEECEDPQESSSCYIFIPHTTLFKSNYVKNDILFLDIKIRQNGKLETSL